MRIDIFYLAQGRLHARERLVFDMPCSLLPCVEKFLNGIGERFKSIRRIDYGWGFSFA